ncbi:MAG: heavy-metal-associated domain-containing protein [Flavobacteriales bacterium]|nr:heavy-metal-associated domain-containing protein [Flavobacteriales bacterium]MBK6943922.1 heavy-metal-associated domain-containing protein [Flavobacteriales bacterium]MBK7240130.1 heavy-metal-associated domain-containing protein [Flavobacteriales bacterium]MBK7297810.1 heavy-metal-associated domain-containing protein [Flavobacteriales bacterium]MBK9533593.1 heavy-metal-associated domain-containing protein [Flavobacteriales bacterium]
MKKLIILFLALLTVNSYAQDTKKKKTEQLVIKTTTVCDMCKETIEKNMIYEKGVKKVVVDLEASAVNVEYDPRKNTPEDLRTALIDLGYGADGVPGSEKAFAKLPECCQKEGCGKVAPERNEK